LDYTFIFVFDAFFLSLSKINEKKETR